MYSEQLLEHFKNPHNQGKMDNPTVVGVAGNPVCGDTMKIYLVVSDKGGPASGGESPKAKVESNTPLTPLKRGTKIIEDIKFETLGCAAAISSSSVFTDMVKGKTIEEALNITKDDIVKELGGLPDHKVHCSLIAVDALRNAIEKLLH